jgi:dipeptidyl-peptidase-4
MRTLAVFILLFSCSFLKAQRRSINWTPDGTGFTRYKDGAIVRVDPKTDAETVLFSKEVLTPAGSSQALRPQSYSYSSDNNKLLLFVNTAKVWRYQTRGDYWVYDQTSKTLRQLGKDLPSQSLMRLVQVNEFLQSRSRYQGSSHH